MRLTERIRKLIQLGTVISLVWYVLNTRVSFAVSVGGWEGCVRAGNYYGFGWVGVNRRSGIHVQVFAVGFWATVSKTTRPILPDRCLSVCL